MCSFLQKKKPVDIETTVIQSGGTNTGAGGNNTRNRLTNLNSGNQNNTTNNSSNNEQGGGGHATSAPSQQSTEMNDIQVRVINDNVNTSGSGGTTSGSRSNWRHNEATIEVAMASPEEEN